MHGLAKAKVYGKARERISGMMHILSSTFKWYKETICDFPIRLDSQASSRVAYPVDPSKP